MQHRILRGKTLILAFLVTISLFFNIIPMRMVYAQPTRLYVDPSRIVDTALISGENFSVSVKVENVVDLYSWQLELRFERTLLDTTADLGEEGPFLKSQGTTTFTKENRTRGVRFNCTITDPVSGASGNGTLVTVTFIVLGRGYTALRLTGIALEDSARNPISYTWTDGGFRNTEEMYVEPITTAKNPGETFDVDVKVANVTNVYGWGFTMNWKVGLITYVDAIEGPFLQAGGPTFFAKDYTPSSAALGCTLTGQVPGVTGSGILATVRLQVYQNTGNCTLDLADTKLVGVNTTTWIDYPISHTSQDGYFYTTRPVSAFTWTPDYPSKDETVNFNATACYDPDQPFKNQAGMGIVSYYWEFGDDTESTETDPFTTHTYTEYTIYNVNLTVTDDDGEWWETSKTLAPVKRDVAVTNIQTSHVEAMAGTIVQVNVTVANIGEIKEEFNVTAYYDTNIIGKNVTELVSDKDRIVTFEWNTTGVPLGVYNISARADIVSLYEINTTNNELINATQVLISTLNVVVKKIQIGGVTFTYIIKSNSTITNIFFNQAGKEISFNVTGPEGTAGFCNVTIPMRLLNATPPEAWIVKFDGVNISYTLSTNGTHSFIYFTYDHTSHKIQIVGTSVATAPEASFIITPLPAYAYRTITFDATASDDPDGTIVSYYWEFGDESNATETNAITTHTYIDANYYNITLTVTDDEGLNATAWKQLNVKWFIDITILNVIVSPTAVKYEENVAISVPVKNNGDISITFEVIVYYGNETVQENVIAEQTITDLAPGASTTVDFVWNTTGVAVNIYTIKAVANVPEDPTDNTWVNGQVTIERLSSSTTISASSTNPTIGEGIIISGSVTPPKEGAKVFIGYRTAGQEVWVKLGMGTTTEEGIYFYTWNPQTIGEYEVYASRLFDETIEGSNSTIITITVSKIVSAISIELSQTSIPLGNQVTISGSISPPRENASVTLHYRLTGEGWATLEPVKTNQQGIYAFQWTPQNAGTYELKTSWSGDENTSEAETVVETITVEAPPSDDLLIYGLAIVVIGLVAAIAIYILKFRK